MLNIIAYFVLHVGAAIAQTVLYRNEVALIVNVGRPKHYGIWDCLHLAEGHTWLIHSLCN